MEKTTNNHLLPAGTGPERAPISKVSEGPVPAGKKTSPGVPTGDCPDAEVPQRPVRRSFLADYKLQDSPSGRCLYASGQVGELLRREGLYSSHLSTWRAQRRAGDPGCPGPQEAWSQASRQGSTHRGEPSPGTRE